MSKLTLADIADIRAYERERDEFRRQRHRAQEAAPRHRSARSSRSCSRTRARSASRSRKWPASSARQRRRIETEIRVYNPLVPEPGHVAATMFIELTNDADLRRMAAQARRRSSVRAAAQRRRARRAVPGRRRPREPTDPRRHHLGGPLRASRRSNPARSDALAPRPVARWSIDHPSIPPRDATRARYHRRARDHLRNGELTFRAHRGHRRPSAGGRALLGHVCDKRDDLGRHRRAADGRRSSPARRPRPRSPRSSWRSA